MVKQYIIITANVFIFSYLVTVFLYLNTKFKNILIKSIVKGLYFFSKNVKYIQTSVYNNSSKDLLLKLKLSKSTKII